METVEVTALLMRLNTLIWNWLELFQAKIVQSDLINSLRIIQRDKTTEVAPYLQVCY